MAQPPQPASRPDLDRDKLSIFLLEHSGVRGALVRLDAAWQAIASRNDYPAPVAARLFPFAIRSDLARAARLLGSG